MVVFISYSNTDSQLAKSVANELKALGIEYFLDKKDVNWGDRITHKVSGGLVHSTAIVLIVSPASLKSQWVPFEVGQAMAMSKLILPLLSHPSLELPSYLSDIAYVTDVSEVHRYFREYSERESVQPDQPTQDRSIDTARLSTDATFYTYDKMSLYDVEEKRCVAEYVVQNYLKEGDSIAIDAGTSMHAVARAIYDTAIREPNQTHYTIMTHNYAAFGVLENLPAEAYITSYLAGGRYDRNLAAFYGTVTLRAYEGFYPKVVLLGVSGLLANVGLFCHSLTEEANVKQLLVSKPCSIRLVLATWRKLGITDSFCFASMSELVFNTHKCVLIVNEPPKDASPREQETFFRQMEMLSNHSIEIVRITPSGQ